MKAAAAESKSTRELLQDAIIRVLQSWPDRDRAVFALVHYQGRSTRDVARDLGLEVEQVDRTLQACEFKLRRSLKGFRGLDLESRVNGRDGSAEEGGY